MTRITLKLEGTLTALRVNGRIVAFDGRIKSINKTGAGKWQGVADIGEFTIIGGRGSGGASNEWFVYFPAVYGETYLPTRSAAESLRAVESV